MDENLRKQCEWLLGQVPDEGLDEAFDYLIRVIVFWDVKDWTSHKEGQAVQEWARRAAEAVGADLS